MGPLRRGGEDRETDRSLGGRLPIWSTLFGRPFGQHSWRSRTSVSEEVLAYPLSAWITLRSAVLWTDFYGLVDHYYYPRKNNGGEHYSSLSRDWGSVACSIMYK
jgi:hypothetical protein